MLRDATDGKLDFDMPEMMRRLARAAAPYPQAAMFQLADDGYVSLFEQLVAALVSVRTLNEVTLPACRRLFEVVRTPADAAMLGPDEIAEMIRPVLFHRAKGQQIHAIAEQVLADHAGELPCDFDSLVAFRGVGPKVANLAIAVACPQPHSVPVDIHVHRVTNRWGLVQARTPEATGRALEHVLPRRQWAQINRLCVPFGKFACTRARPRCSTCPLLPYCRQVGVQAKQ